MVVNQGMDKAAQRAAERAANSLLKAAGYDAHGKRLRKGSTKRKTIKRSGKR